MDAREINKAIAAHGVWKIRLRDAIECEVSEYDPVTVSKDTECEFGKWFYSINVADRSEEFWAKVQKLHEQFHILAGRILKLALEGKKEEAHSIVNDINGEFVSTSIELTNTLYEWKKKILLLRGDG